jgi:trans-aconitate methyltransferase
MTEETAPDYTFGDSTTAGDRLALLAHVFGPSSEALLRRAAPPATALAVDLGCGPGVTTALLARASGASRTVGLDSSEAFVAQARRHHDGKLEFAVHDATRTPFPTPRVDLLFARFLLAHLPNPTAVVDAWCSQLTAGGRFVTDETEHIDTAVDTFTFYEAMARSMVAHYGANLQVGGVTRDLPPPRDTTVIHSELTEVRPTTAVVARLYAMNLATWRHDPFIVESVPSHEIERLAGELAGLEESNGTNELAFCNRQVIYERA